MPRSCSTPERASVEEVLLDLEADVGLDEPEADVGLDEAPPSVPIYSHGYSLRVELLLPKDETDAALVQLGWPDPEGDWRKCQVNGATRWIMRGTTFLTQRKPRNKKLPLAKKNKAWTTNLYSLQVERAQAEETPKTSLDLHGVRRADVDRLLHRVMGLASEQYKVAYYRTAERYVALDPVDAMRLADALGATPISGRGRSARKRFLLKDHKIPVTVRKRTRRVALLNVYRIGNGATAAYRCEIRLAGKTRHRGHFEEADIEKLDNALLALLSEHDIEVRRKPARWEPRSDRRYERDKRLEMLPSKAYRGSRVAAATKATAAKCHTPIVALVGLSAGDTATSVGLPYIRQAASYPEDSEHERTEEEENEDRGQGEDDRDGSAWQIKRKDPCPSPIPNPILWGALVDDLLHYEGTLSEVSLHPEQSPGPLLQALVEKAPKDSVAIQALCHVSDFGIDTWHSVLNMMAGHPVSDDTKTMVIVVDPSVHTAISDATSVWDGERFHAGPIIHPGWLWERFSQIVRATGAWLFDLMGELRQVCEQTGFRIILVTVDARPDHGRGDLRRSHFFRDARVRSIIGDAGRYWCHTRYRVEQGYHGPYRVVMVKDEAEGLMGRMVWGSTAFEGQPGAEPEPLVDVLAEAAL